MAEQENGKDRATEAEEKQGVMLRIAWSELGPALFANQVLALTDENMLHLGFYQIALPLILGDTDEDRRQVIESLEQRGTVDAKLVAHITLPISKLTSIIDVLTKQATKRGLTPESK